MAACLLLFQGASLSSNRESTSVKVGPDRVDHAMTLHARLAFQIWSQEHIDSPM